MGVAKSEFDGPAMGVEGFWKSEIDGPAIEVLGVKKFEFDGPAIGVIGVENSKFGGPATGVDGVLELQFDGLDGDCDQKKLLGNGEQTFCCRLKEISVGDEIEGVGKLSEG